MANLNELKLRIRSVKSTQKITKAKKMVAAAKLRRAEEAAKAARPYAERMEAVLANLASGVGDAENAPKLLAGTGEDKVHLLIVATADRGLCGGFNSNIVRKAREAIVRLEGEGKQVKILCVGKKGKEQLNRLYSHLIIGSMELSSVRTVGFANGKEIADDILSKFDAGEFDKAHLFFGKFKNVMTQEPTELQIIPAKAPENAETPDLQGSVYEYEPDEEAILKTLLPRYVAVQMFRALLENAASEQAASMTAMDNATRNAGDMIDALTLQFNRARQAKITTELIEIIAGAESV